jgi:hypothetical protein
MSGWLLAFDEQELRRSTESLRQVIRAGDAAQWRSYWLSRGQRISGVGQVDELLEQGTPVVGSKQAVAALRLAARQAAVRSADLWERHWHVHYPGLSDDEAGFPVSESDEYEAIGLHVFTTSPAPAGLEFLDEQPDVATNWISQQSVHRLWRLEQAEGMLSVAGASMSARHTPFGHDLLTLRGMLEFCDSTSAALFLWDSGT